MGGTPLALSARMSPAPDAPREPQRPAAPPLPPSTDVATPPPDSGNGRAADPMHNAAPPAPPGAPRPASRERRRRNVGWRSRDILRTAALVIAMYLVLRLLWFAQVLVFTVFLGALFGLAVSGGVDRLQRWRIPRGVGAALIVFGSLGLLGGLGAWMAPTLRAQSRELRVKLPEAVDNIERWVEKRQGGVLGALFQAGDATADATRQATTGAARVATGGSPRPDTGAGRQEAQQGAPPAAGQGTATTAGAEAPRTGQGGQAREGGSLRQRVLDQMSGASRHLFGFFTSTLAAVAGFILVMFLTIYIAADPKVYHDGLMHLFPHGARRRAGEVLTAMATVLRKWLVAQLIAMLVIGAVTTIALLVLKVEAALPLGILAGLMEFIPTVGPLLSAVPAVAMGFVDSPEKALTIALVYMGIQFLENHLLIPILMKEGIDIPPAVTILAQALMAMVFGFLGLLVAVPMTAAAMVAIKMLYVQDVVGDDMKVIEDDDEEDDD